MSAWLDWFLGAADFTPRSACGPGWTPGLVRAHVAADLAIALAYYAIPAGLLLMWWRGKGTASRPRIAFLFALFIFACGTGHVLEAGMFWWPAYRVSGAWKWLTALASLLTAVEFLRGLPRVLTFKSPEEYERLLAERDRATAATAALHAEDKRLMAALRDQLDAQRDTVTKRESRTGVDDITLELRSQLHSIRNGLQAHANRVALVANGVDR